MRARTTTRWITRLEVQSLALAACGGEDTGVTGSDGDSKSSIVLSATVSLTGGRRAR